MGKRPKVRLIFRDHAKMELYRREPIGKGAKAFVAGKHKGVPFKPLSPDFFQPKEGNTLHEKTKKRRLKQFREKGGIVVIGETYYTAREGHKMRRLLRERAELRRRMFEYPELSAIKEYF